MWQKGIAKHRDFRRFPGGGIFDIDPIMNAAKGIGRDYAYRLDKSTSAFLQTKLE